MEFAEQLAAERRARLAAERMLEQMRRELGEANRQLATHARHLSSEIVSSREEVGRVRSEAETLKSEVSHVRKDLQRAESAMMIAERRLWDSLETIRDGFAVFNPENVLIAANRAFLAIFDGLDLVKPGADMALLVELLADEGIVDIGGLSSREWQERMLKRVESNRPDHAILKLWNGQYFQLIDRRTRDGDLVTLALNITEQTLREDQLREARERAEAANRAKSAFLANMSHEIRTPMNGVVAMADMLAETELDEEQRAYVETIRTSGEALLVIINDVLDYSKIEAEQISFKSQPFDLERCIHDVVTLLQPGAESKGLQVAVDYDLFMPTSYIGDAGRIRQILTNLVGNAIKFTEKGHVLIRVVGLPGESGRDYRVHVTVEDTGIGIPEDKIEAIFDEFQQVESDRDRAHDGTGLGLAITKRLVSAMGGEVWVDSREGVGSGFGFFLPLDAVEDVEPDTLTAPPWLRRAIVFDDEGMNRTVLLKQLGLIGLTTVTAAAIDDISDARPTSHDIVLIGHDARGTDAFSNARRIAEQFSPAGMILLVSGPTKIPDQGMVFDRVLQRPVLRKALIDCLGELAPPDRQPVSSAEIPPEPHASLEAAGSPAATGARPEQTPRPMRVLAAEDNRTNRFVFEKMLKDLDIELVFVENGEEAVEEFQRIRPDIVFTDISMPRMDGKEATRRIRAFEAEEGLAPCPIVAITAHAMDGDAEDILAAGVDHYLTKPLKKQHLVDHILTAQPLGTRPALPILSRPEESHAPPTSATAAE